MILYPAVDIRDGRAVRLTQGDFDREQIYDADPLDAAKRWEDAGARRLHVVDLDGAVKGRPVNLERLETIVNGVDVPVQVGGGLRTLPDVRAALNAGASRVVMGTAAVTDAATLAAVFEAFGSKVLVAVDVREGKVATAGWTDEARATPAEAIEQVQEAGIRRFIYSDVNVDGTLAGPPIDRVRRACEQVRGQLIYAGGIGSLDDLHALAELRRVNLVGVIVGKALYERRFTVGQAQAVLDHAR